MNQKRINIAKLNYKVYAKWLYMPCMLQTKHKGEINGTIHTLYNHINNRNTFWKFSLSRNA